MAVSLHTSIASLSRFAKIFAGRLKKLGITTVRDLLFYFPFRYDDLSNVVTVAACVLGTRVTIHGTIELIATRRSPRKRMLITEAVVRDATGAMKVVWFQQPFLTKVLTPGTRVALSGVVEDDGYGVQLVSPQYEKIGTGSTIHTGRLVPVYPLASTITGKQFRTVLQSALPSIPEVREWLPEALRATHTLIPLARALADIHFPPSSQALNAATRRLKFDELFLLQLRNAAARQTRAVEHALAIVFHEKETRAFVAHLPFTLTADQKKAAWEILRDLQGHHASGIGHWALGDRELNASSQKPEAVSPMHRLLEGDVGSGKTVVAAIAAYNAILSGYKVLFMAPTEILAEQHAETLQRLFDGTEARVGLLTSAHKLKKKERDAATLIVGTHALLHIKGGWGDIGLTVIDEQHRFGVGQRKELRANGPKGMIPHLLSMTATPIPRTLALTIYGDLDLSILKMMPKGRKQIRTEIVAPQGRLATYALIEEELRKGRQAFVICPLIDPSDTLGVRSATQEYERLQRDVFPRWKVGLLHGRIKAGDKEAIMRDFKDAKVHILVSTAVVEVGVDVPNATVMIIEGAERFGLAQLHQFRGRVGRGEYQSYCFLFTDQMSGNTRARLQAVARTTDGFALAEEDLALRGAGDLSGTQQSGVVDLKIASLSDAPLIAETQAAVRTLVAEDPTFTRWPELATRLKELEEAVHPE